MVVLLGLFVNFTMELWMMQRMHKSLLNDDYGIRVAQNASRWAVSLGDVPFEASLSMSQEYDKPLLVKVSDF
jgi:hypothetical protein